MHIRYIRCIYYQTNIIYELRTCFGQSLIEFDFNKIAFNQAYT